MGKIAGKVPKLQEKLFDFPYFRQKFDRLFLSPYRLRKKTSKKKEQSATVPKDVYCYRYCFLETKECMHNEVGTCAEILPICPLNALIDSHILELKENPKTVNT